MDWSPQQDKALRDCAEWIRNPLSPQVFYLAGFAGTGKTTLARHLVDDHWRFAAFTGKAAHVLRQKGCNGATTIHSLIYRPAGESRQMEINSVEMKIMNLQLNAGEVLTEEEQKQLDFLMRMRKDLNEENRPRFSLWANSPLADKHIHGVVIDEVSMVDERLGRDLESFDKKILVLGDPAQLPPVGAGGFYTSRVPDIMLTEVHRHAKESGILRLATHIREGGSVWGYDDSEDARVIPQLDIDREGLAKLVLNADQVLVGLNATRHTMNRRYRTLIKMTEPGPMPGDRLVCLRNDHQLGLFNGSQWTVQEAANDLDSKTSDLWITAEDDPMIRVDVVSWLHHMIGCPDLLNDMSFERRELAEFDWSYALTTHKAQGSQWKEVVLFDQSKSFRQDARKWLYTGITRASNRLTVIV
jgi:exodeoxyribonuclease-5